MDKSPAPPGAYQEVSLELIQEGAFQKAVNQALRKAVKELVEYERETHDKGGVAAVGIKVKIRRLKGTETHMAIETAITVATPQPKGGSVAVERQGKLLCQPIGTNDEPEQQLFYDAHGRVIGDNGRPAIIDQEPVVGRIGRAAQG